MAILYNFLQILLLVILAPVWALVLLLNKRVRKGLKGRFGIGRVWSERGGKSTVWIHAASLGEVRVSAPICAELSKRFPSYEMIFSASTPVGKKQAMNLIPSAREIFLLPLDFFWVVCSVVKKFRPTFFLVAETELWPNLFFCLRRRGAGIALFNGRISDKSFKRYKIFRFFFRRVLECVDLFLMQTEEDASKISLLGAPAHKIRVTGNVKFDAPYQPLSASQARRLRTNLHLNEGDFAWIAGSIHPEEFPILLDVFRRLRTSFPRIKWIVIPRHLYDISFFEEALKSERFSFEVWNGKKTVEKEWDILLVNALGQLIRLYQLGIVAFVGGSLAPVGGHNPLEPLRYGIPTIFGPEMGNFREIREITLKEGVAFEVGDEDSLFDILLRLLENPRERGEIRERAFRMFERYQGAIQRTIRLLERWMRDRQ